jgi:hypothetical protein
MGKIHLLHGWLISWLEAAPPHFGGIKSNHAIKIWSFLPKLLTKDNIDKYLDQK